MLVIVVRVATIAVRVTRVAEGAVRATEDPLLPLIVVATGDDATVEAESWLWRKRALEFSVHGLTLAANFPLVVVLVRTAMVHDAGAGVDGDSRVGAHRLSAVTLLLLALDGLLEERRRRVVSLNDDRLLRG